MPQFPNQRFELLFHINWTIFGNKVFFFFLFSTYKLFAKLFQQTNFSTKKNKSQCWNICLCFVFETLDFIKTALGYFKNIIIAVYGRRKKR